MIDLRKSKWFLPFLGFPALTLPAAARQPASATLSVKTRGWAEARINGTLLKPPACASHPPFYCKGKEVTYLAGKDFPLSIIKGSGEDEVILTVHEDTGAKGK